MCNEIIQCYCLITKVASECGQTASSRCLYPNVLNNIKEYVENLDLLSGLFKRLHTPVKMTLMENTTMPAPPYQLVSEPSTMSLSHKNVWRRTD